MALNMNKIKIIQAQPAFIKGKVQYFPEGMSINERLKEQNEPSSAFAEKERILVKGIASLNDYDNKYVLIWTLYNGANKTITSVVIRLIARDIKDVVLWDKIFRTMISITPSSSQTLNLPLTDVQDVASIIWMIEEVHG
jgi:hypothetical protein